jgi:hypothetical protein
MKTERRHELATNDLADWIGDKVEELKPYSTAIWATVLAVTVLILAAVYWSRKSEAKLEQGWDRYFQARTQESLDELRNVADADPKSPAGLWARSTLGDRRLAEGVNLLFENRADAQEALSEAVDSYEYVLKNAPAGSLLAERATFGLGEAFESQNELDKAREQYEALKAKWPGGAFSAEADRRLGDLERSTTKSFYDWFAKQEPKRKPAAGPLGTEKSGSKKAVDEKPGDEKSGDEKKDAAEAEADKPAPTSEKSSEASDEPGKASAESDKPSAEPSESKE